MCQGNRRPFLPCSSFFYCLEALPKVQKTTSCRYASPLVGGVFLRCPDSLRKLVPGFVLIQAVGREPALSVLCRLGMTPRRQDTEEDRPGSFF